MALEHSTLLYLNYTDIAAMFIQFPEANIIAHTLFAKQHMANNERLELMMTLKSVDRYQKFTRQHAWALNRVKLSFIASYLNMTPEQLSRVRSHI